MSSSNERTNRVTSLAAIFVAIVSMGVAVHDNIETRKHNRLSVKPFLSVERTINVSADENGNILERSCQLTLENRGLGPAILTAFEIKIDSTIYPDWQSAVLAAGSEQQISSSTTLLIGDVLNEDHQNELITLSDDMGKTDKIELEIRYESVYGEPFEVSGDCDLSKIN